MPYLKILWQSCRQQVKIGENWVSIILSTAQEYVLLGYNRKGLNFHENVVSKFSAIRKAYKPFLISS